MSCVSSFALLSVIDLVCLGLVVLVRLSLSYGIRHMHSIVPYHLIELVFYHAIHVMLISTILLSVSLFPLQDMPWFLKYRGSAAPSIRAVHSKALYPLERT